MVSKYGGQTRKRRGSKKRRSLKKSRTQKGSGRNVERKIKIGTRGGATNNLKCPICSNTIFKTQKTLLPRGRLWDFFLGDTFDKSCRVFKCSNCGHIDWFSGGVEYVAS